MASQAKEEGSTPLSCSKVRPQAGFFVSDNMPQKEKIQQMFDGIAPDYDRLNHLMSLGVDRSALSAELSRMAREGVLETRRSHFMLHE